MAELSLKEKAELFDKFIKFYAEDVPFGSQSKTNTDAFIYGLLEESGYLREYKTTQDIAIKLRITPAKVRSLILNSVLQEGFKVKVEDILECIGSSAKYSKNDSIAVEIDNPVIKMEIKRVCSDQKIFADSSFNAHILKFPIEQYCSLLRTFLNGADECSLIGQLIKEIEDTEWEIKKKDIEKSPFLTILQKGASLATAGITDIIPTEIISKAIIKFLKIRETNKKSK